MDNLTENFINNLEFVLLEKEWTNTNLAFLLDIPVLTVHHWFEGKSKPTVDQLLEIGQQLEFSIDAIFYENFRDKTSNYQKRLRAIKRDKIKGIVP